MHRSLQRDETRDDSVVQIEPGRCRAARGEGRRIQFVIGEQHQRAADQVGRVLVVRRPDPRHLLVQQLVRWRSVQHGRDQQPQDAAADHRAAVRRAGEGAGIGACRQCQHGDRPIDRLGAARGLSDGAHFVRDLRTIVRRERIDAGDVPQQRRGVLQRVALGELDAVDAAIDRTLLGDGRDRRIHHRQVGVEIAEAARLRRRHAALLQPPDVLGAVAVAARIRRRLGADQPAADIGVEGRRRDREFGRGLPGGEIELGGFFHIDLYNQD
ncbi:hypothetical protein ACVIST_000452 [Bradyrhizobium elkanii]